MGKSSTSEDEPEDGTDNEQHDSLPDDPVPKHKPVKGSFSWGSNEFQTVANKALQMKKKKQLESMSKRSIESAEATCVKHQKGKKNRGKSQEINDSLPEGVEEDNKHVPIDQETKKPLRRRDSVFNSIEVSTSKMNKQDSETSSVWSDNIPVITISKTESYENIIDKNQEQPAPAEPKYQFKPKIKCVLKKQSTEIDEDTICYFGEDLERNKTESKIIEAIVESSFEDSTRDEIDESDDIVMDYLEDSRHEEALTDKSSSEETEHKDSSVDTVLNASVKEKC